MGWCESPSFFCAVIETARDIIETIIKNPLPSHPLENKMLSAVSPSIDVPKVPYGPLPPEVCTIVYLYYFALAYCILIYIPSFDADSAISGHDPMVRERQCRGIEGLLFTPHPSTCYERILQTYVYMMIKKL